MNTIEGDREMSKHENKIDHDGITTWLTFTGATKMCLAVLEDATDQIWKKWKSDYSDGFWERKEVQELVELAEKADELKSQLEIAEKAADELKSQLEIAEKKLIGEGDE